MVSICVPYHNSPKTAFHLSRLLESLNQQTYKDYEIILTDEPGMAHNHNAAILKGKGELIKLMQSDDYFAHPQALQDIVENFKPEDNWMISACGHDKDGVIGWPHFPEWSDDMITGNNTLGGVSTLTLRRTSILLFDESLSWMVDCQLYTDLKLKYGLPKLLNSVNVIIDVRTDRLTHTIPDAEKQREVIYLMNKYDRKGL